MPYKKKEEKRGEGGKEGRREGGKEEKNKAGEKWVCGFYVQITLSTTVLDSLRVPLEMK